MSLSQEINILWCLVLIIYFIEISYIGVHVFFIEFQNIFLYLFIHVSTVYDMTNQIVPNHYSQPAKPLRQVGYKTLQLINVSQWKVYTSIIIKFIYEF